METEMQEMKSLKSELKVLWSKMRELKEQTKTVRSRIKDSRAQLKAIQRKRKAERLAKLQAEVQAAPVVGVV
jgi:chromosome segregation ATPase